MLKTLILQLYLLHFPSGSQSILFFTWVELFVSKWHEKQFLCRNYSSVWPKMATVLFAFCCLDVPTRPSQKLMTWILVSTSELTVIFLYMFLTRNNLWLCLFAWNLDGSNMQKSIWHSYFIDLKTHNLLKLPAWIQPTRCPLRLFCQQRGFLFGSDLVCARPIFFAPHWRKLSQWDGDSWLLLNSKMLCGSSSASQFATIKVFVQVKIFCLLSYIPRRDFEFFSSNVWNSSDWSRQLTPVVFSFKLEIPLIEESDID